MVNTRFLANRLDAGLISGSSGILDFITGQTGYIEDLWVTGSGGAWCKVLCSSSVNVADCAFVVTPEGRVGFGTCDPQCDIDIRGNVCHTSGNYISYSGYLSGRSGILDWLSGNSGYMLNEFTVGTGDCTFIVTTGGDIGINTCDPKCGVDIYSNVCHSSGNFTNYSGYLSGQSGIFDWLSGNSGYMRDEFTVGTGDCVFIVTTGGDIGINTCDPLCDIDIRGDICHNSGNYINNIGYISGKTGIFDWLSGNSGYMRDEFTVGTGDCVFVVTTGGRIGVNTCDPQCDLEIYADTCLRSGNFTNYSGHSYFYNDVHISGGNLSVESFTSSGLPPILWTGVPPTDTSYGLPGLAAYDNTHLYICTGTNKWGRTSLNGWS